jgi:hypothetical protein
MSMQLSVEEFREGFRRGTLAFFLPAAHAELSCDYLEDFSERILKQDWREVSMHAHRRMSELLADDDSEVDLIALIEEYYGLQVSNVADMTLWEVIRYCSGADRFRASIRDT